VCGKGCGKLSHLWKKRQKKYISTFSTASKYPQPVEMWKTFANLLQKKEMINFVIFCSVENTLSYGVKPVLISCKGYLLSR
jgi:hypothetical protein